jgi:hypothetical protein
VAAKELLIADKGSHANAVGGNARANMKAVMRSCA